MWMLTLMLSTQAMMPEQALHKYGQGLLCTQRSAAVQSHPQAPPPGMAAASRGCLSLDWASLLASVYHAGHQVQLRSWVHRLNACHGCCTQHVHVAPNAAARIVSNRRHRCARWSHNVMGSRHSITTDASESIAGHLSGIMSSWRYTSWPRRRRQPHRPLTSALRWMSDVGAADGWRHLCSWTSGAASVTDYGAADYHGRAQLRGREDANSAGGSQTEVRAQLARSHELRTVAIGQDSRTCCQPADRPTQKQGTHAAVSSYIRL
jgi:hypothetical protein